MQEIYSELIALAQVIVIDLVLAGDNAIVVGIAASRVAPELRARVIFWGMAGAVALRIAFAAVTVQLLALVGLTLAGGILLLWVCWKMYREIVRQPQPAAVGAAAARADGEAIGTIGFRSALAQIIVADVSMSLDNVLAVAGAAKGHTWVLVVGLGIAVVLMAVAASYIARLLTRFPWITWIGLLIILYVALDMMWRGSLEVACTYVPPAVCGRGLIATLASILG
ncbi:MAG: YjbE family putative metal transport protein [Hyphomicrobiaceae bacterium]|nr:MAG: YjbE family putative metal transport protein [Hyphomicrobiaceae bacterium]